MPPKPCEHGAEAIWEAIARRERDRIARECFRGVGTLATSFVLGCAAAWSIFVLDRWTIVWFAAVWATHEAVEFIVRRRWP